MDLDLDLAGNCGMEFILPVAILTTFLHYQAHTFNSCEELHRLVYKKPGTKGATKLFNIIEMTKVLACRDKYLITGNISK